LRAMIRICGAEALITGEYKQYRILSPVKEGI
jgi:hypothetical protein